MRILYYSTSYYADHGGSIQALELYSYLDKIDLIDAKSIFPSKKKNEIIENKGGAGFLKRNLKVFPLLQVFSFYRRNSFYLKELEKKILEFKPDVLLMQIDSNFLQIHNLKKKFPDLKICTQINGSPFDESFINILCKKRFLEIQRMAYEASDLNIFISDYSRRSIMGDYVNKDRDVVIHNGTDTKKFFPLKNKINLRKMMGYSASSFIIGYIGTLDYHKKLEILIDAFADLKGDFEKLRLVIIGDGPAMSKLKLYVKKLKIEDTVKFKGWVEHKNINEHLNCFDVAVHHYANAYMNPLKVFEYLSSGLPVIAPNIPSVKEIFKDKEDLLLTNSNKEDLKENLNSLIRDKDLRFKLSNKQHLIVSLKNEFTWERYAKRVVEVINDL